MKFFYVLPFVSAVFAALLANVQADADLFDPCSVTDMKCLRKSTKTFLEHTHKGIPEMDIVPIDPLFIAAVDLRAGDEDAVYENRNVVLKGLKDQELTDYKMDLKAKSVWMTTAADLTIDSDVTGVFKSGKRIPGHAIARGYVNATVAYKYELKKDNKGVEHFEVGPETVSCELITPPVMQYNAVLQRALSSDAEAKAHAAHAHPDKNFCSMVEMALHRAVHNIRAAGKALPASAFFKDIHGA